jgi:ABC-type lipoprotein export system ATPase subunit
MLILDDVEYVLPGGRRLFRGVHLLLSPGDAVAIEGPSGTGKSTLLAIIGGLLQPTSGTVTFGAPCQSDGIAWVLQGLNSLGARSALDNAALYSLIDGANRSAARRVAAEQLVGLGLGGHLNTRVRRLSGGELQRVAVARALSCRRPLVLADEPTNQLDRQNARHVMSAIFGGARQGRAVVAVTHDRDALSDSCKVMRLSENGLHEVSLQPR